MAGLLATDIIIVLAHVLDDIAVADLRARKTKALVPKEALKAEIGHDGRDDTVAAQLLALGPAFGDDGHQLIAIDDRTVFVHDDDAVGIAIERDADIGAHLVDLLLQGDRAGRATIQIDI